MKLLVTLFMFSQFSINASEIRTNSEFEEFLTLNEVVLKKALVFVGKIKIGKLVEATNYEGYPVCIESILLSKTNVKNEFLNNGKVLIMPGETLPLGGFTSIDRSKNWHAKWRHIKRVNLSVCLNQK